MNAQVAGLGCGAPHGLHPGPDQHRSVAPPLRRAARGHLRMLAYEITVAEARERDRIACGLHDDIGQLLTLVSLELGELREATDGEAAALVEETRGLVAEAAQATRSATFDLCNPVLRLGLQAALSSLVDRLSRAGRMTVRLQGNLPPLPLPLPEPVQAVVFRVVRELCLNAQKHAGAQQLVITVRG